MATKQIIDNRLVDNTVIIKRPLPKIGGDAPDVHNEVLVEDTTKFDTDVNDTDIANYGNIYPDQNINKKRAQYQSTVDQFGNAVGRIVTDAIGGTIQAIGATAELPISLYDEYNKKDADFSNWMTELGTAIQEKGKEAMPIYRENPNASWDVSDPAWWAEGVENAGSTLQFLLPAAFALKGFGALAKLTQLEKGLIQLGKLEARIAAKVVSVGERAAGAIVSRNAENMQEAYQLRNQTIDSSLSDMQKDPTLFDKLAKGEIGQELAKEGKEITPENIAKRIGGYAAWRDYKINGLNIAFDFMQMAAFAKYIPKTRAASTSATQLAENELLGAEAVAVKAATKLDKFKKVMNPVGTYAKNNLSEAPEEMINDIGAREGQAYADQLSGKKVPSLTERLANYVNPTTEEGKKVYESGFWGLFGGMLFGGASSGVSRLMNGKQESSDDLRVNEIKNRKANLEQFATELKDLQNDTTLSPADKAQAIARAKGNLGAILGLPAIKSENTDGVLNWVKSKAFRQEMIDKGIASENDVDAAIQHYVEDIGLTEELYKKHSSDFYYLKGKDSVKSVLLNHTLNSDYTIQKAKERIGKISEEIVKLKTEDGVLNHSDEYTALAIEIEALKRNGKDLQEFLKTEPDGFLKSEGLKRIQIIQDQIAEKTTLLGTNKPDISKINPAILNKTALVLNLQEAILHNNNKILDYKNTSKWSKVFEDAKKNQIETDHTNFISLLDKEIADGKHTPETLNIVYEAIKNDTRKAKYVQEKIVDAENKQKEDERNQEILDAAAAVKAEEERLKQNPAATTTDKFKITEISDEDLNSLEGEDALHLTVLHGLSEKLDSGADVNETLNELQPFTQEEFIKNPVILTYARNIWQNYHNYLETMGVVVNLNTPIENESLDEIKEGNDINEIVGYTQKTETPNSAIITRVNESSIFIPIFRTKSGDISETDKSTANGQVIKRDAEGNIIIEEGDVNFFRDFFNSNFGEGTEISISVDTTHPDFLTHENNPDEIPLQLSYIKNGKLIKAPIYLGGIAGAKKQAEIGNEALKASRVLDLQEIQRIRKYINGEVGKTLTSHITYKGNGTIFNTEHNHSTEGIFNGYYTIKPGTEFGKNVLVNIQDENDVIPFESKEFFDGILYGVLPNANGAKNIPVKLSISKLSEADSKKVTNLMVKLVREIEKGVTNENTTVQYLKNEIAKYIKVDKVKANHKYGNTLGFRVYPKGVNKHGEETPANLQFSYYTPNGKIFTAKVLVDDNGQVVYKVYTDTGALVEDYTMAEWGEKSFPIANIIEILQHKYYNVDLTTSKKVDENGVPLPFVMNGTTYTSYYEYLSKEGIVQTNVGQVLTNNNKPISTDEQPNSHLWAFNNDTKLFVSTQVSELQYTRVRSKATENAIKAVTERLKKRFGVNAVVINELNFKYNGIVSNGTPLPGLTKLYPKGTVIINTAYADLDNPIHETFHIILEVIKQNDSTKHIYEALVKELSENKSYIQRRKEIALLYKNEVKGLTPEQRENYLNTETIVSLIGNLAADNINEETGNILKKFIDWVKSFLTKTSKKYKALFGRKEVTAEDFVNFTIQDFANFMSVGTTKFKIGDVSNLNLTGLSSINEYETETNQDKVRKIARRYNITNGLYFNKGVNFDGLLTELQKVNPNFKLKDTNYGSKMITLNGKVVNLNKPFLASKIEFEESSSEGYADRTTKNASADATIAIAVDFTSAGEKLTKSKVLEQNKKYIPIDANKLEVTKERVDKIVEKLNSVNKQEVIEQPIQNKEGIDFVFEQTPELAKIGSKEQYSQYLESLNKPNTNPILQGNQANIEEIITQLEKEGLLEIDCKGKLKAEKGLATAFTKGGKWKVIKDLKGYPTHKEGGVDLTIGKGGVSIKNGNTQFTAKYGLVIPKN